MLLRLSADKFSTNESYSAEGLKRRTTMTAAATRRPLGRREIHILFIFQYPTLLLDSSLPTFFAPFSAFGKLAAGEEFPHKPSWSEMDLRSYVDGGSARMVK